MGAYLEQENNGEPIRVSLPDNFPPADLVDEEVLRLLQEKTQGPTPLGHHPETGEPIFVLIGPYGPYVQLGENGENGGGAKPRRVSLPKGTKPGKVTLDQALGAAANCRACWASIPKPARTSRQASGVLDRLSGTMAITAR